MDLDRGVKESRDLLGRGKIREAMARLMHLTEKYPDDEDVRGLLAETLNRRGISYAESGELDRAETDFQRSLRFRETAMAHVNLGRVHQSRREFDDTFSEYSRALEMDEDLPEAHEFLGYYFIETGDFDQAMTAFGRSLSKGTWNKNIYLGLWEAYVGLGRMDQAHETAEELAKKLPQDDEVAAQLGLSWAVCQGEYDRAEEAWSRAVQLNGRNLSALFNLAGLAAVRSRRQEALGYLRRCVEIDRDRTLALWKNDLHAQKQKFAAYAGDEDFLDLLGAIPKE